MVSFQFHLPFLPAVANRFLGALMFTGRGMAPKTSLPAEAGIRFATAPSAPASRTRRAFVFPMF
jgi:hypothetical protein